MIVNQCPKCFSFSACNCSWSSPIIYTPQIFSSNTPDYKIKIRNSANGYIAVDAIGNEYVFESMEGLISWLKENLIANSLTK